MKQKSLSLAKLILVIIVLITGGAVLAVTGYVISLKKPMSIGVAPAPITTSTSAEDVINNVGSNNSIVLKTVIVNVSQLKVSASNTTKSAQLGMVYKDENYLVLEENNGWYKIQTLKGVIGWISGSYVTIKTDRANISGSVSTVTINVPKLRVRSLNSTEGKILSTVKMGEVYSVLEENNGWYKIQTPEGIFGWISGIYSSKSIVSKKEYHYQLYGCGYDYYGEFDSAECFSVQNQIDPLKQINIHGGYATGQASGWKNLFVVFDECINCKIPEYIQFNTATVSNTSCSLFARVDINNVQKYNHKIFPADSRSEVELNTKGFLKIPIKQSIYDGVKSFMISPTPAGCSMNINNFEITYMIE